MASEHECYELTEFQKGAIVEGCKLAKQAEDAYDLKIPRRVPFSVSL